MSFKSFFFFNFSVTFLKFSRYPLTSGQAKAPGSGWKQDSRCSGTNKSLGTTSLPLPQTPNLQLSCHVTSLQITVVLVEQHQFQFVDCFSTCTNNLQQLRLRVISAKNVTLDKMYRYANVYCRKYVFFSRSGLFLWTTGKAEFFTGNRFTRINDDATRLIFDCDGSLAGIQATVGQTLEIRKP